MNTLLVAFSANFAVSVRAVSLVVTDVPIPPSVAPSTSAMASAGMWSIRRLLHVGREHRARRDHQAQAREVPAIGLVVEGPQQRLGEGVADDDQVLHALPLHRVPQLDGVEPTTLQQHGGAAEQVGHHHPEPAAGAVHQRRSRHRHQRGAGGEHLPRRGGQPRGVVDRRQPDHRRVRAQEELGEVAHRVHDALRHARSCRRCRRCRRRRRRRRCGPRARSSARIVRRPRPRRRGWCRRVPGRRRPRSGGAGRPRRDRTRATRSPSEVWNTSASMSALSSR